MMDSNNTTSHIYENNTDLVSLDLHPQVIIELTLLSEYLSKKLTSFCIPQHIPLLISKFEKETQLEVTQKAIKLIKSQNITDTKFSWPSHNELKIVFGQPRDTQSYVIQVNGVKSLPTQNKLCDYLIKHSKSIICIPGNKIHPTYLINKKTNSVSIVTDKESIISLQDVKTQNVYVIPPILSRFLELETSSKLKITKFQNHSSLLQKTKNINSKGIILLQ